MAGWVWRPGMVVPVGVAGPVGCGAAVFQASGLVHRAFRGAVRVRAHVRGDGRECGVPGAAFRGVNIGDVLTPADTMRMAMLGIALQVEVVTVWD